MYGKAGSKEERGEGDGEEGIAREKAGIMLQTILRLRNNKPSINGAVILYSLIHYT